MFEQHDVHPVSDEWAKKAWIDNQTYLKEYERSIKDPDGFWSDQAKRLDWFKAPTHRLRSRFGSRAKCL